MVSNPFHWQQPGLVAMPETDGHGDTCGPIVLADYLHLLGKFDLTIQNIDNLRQELINLKLMDLPGETGEYLTQLRDAFIHYGVTPLKFVGFDLNLNTSAFHQDIINALTNKQLVVYETGAAYNLPDGQRGVNYHFVLLGGIDSNLGYLTCNGDTYTALNSKTPVSPVWYGIGSIIASKPVGYIILPAIPEPTPPPPPPPPAPAPVPAPPPAPVPVNATVDEIKKFLADLAAFIGGYKW